MSIMEVREQRIFRASPVTDLGIDLRRGKSAGVKGYGWKRTPKMPTQAPYDDRKCARCKPMSVQFVERQKPTINEIQEAVCVLANLQVSELISECKERQICDYRQIAMLLARMLTTKSLPFIGRQFGNRDHTCVFHAARKYKPVENHLRQTMSDRAGVMDWAFAAVSYARKEFPKFGEPRG